MSAYTDRYDTVAKRRAHARYIAAWRLKNLTRVRQYARNWTRQWRKENLEHARAIARKSAQKRRANPVGRLQLKVNGAIRRCHNPKDARYIDYGARGIKVWAPWVKNRAAFVRYLRRLKNWEKADMQLDRINNNRGYFPGNVRFVSRGDNMKNRRKIRDLQHRILFLQRQLQKA